MNSVDRSHPTPGLVPGTPTPLQTPTPPVSTSATPARDDIRRPPKRENAVSNRPSGEAAPGSSSRGTGLQPPRTSIDEVRSQIDDLAQSNHSASQRSSATNFSGPNNGDIEMGDLGPVAQLPGRRPLRLEPPLATRLAPATSTSNRQELSTFASARVRTPGVTGLHDYAEVSSELALRGGQPPTAPRTSRLNAIASAIKRSVGLADDVTWMANRMRDVRANAFGAEARTGAAPTNTLAALRGRQPVTAFWRLSGLADGAPFGRGSDTLLQHFDRLAAVHTPELALAVSLACRSAQTQPNAHASGAALELLRTADARELGALLEHAHPAPAQALARGILESCCDNNHFDAMVHALAPAFDDARMPALRRLLQAGRANAPGGLADRVRLAAGAELGGGDFEPSQTQRVESFLWDNGFHEDGPGSTLNEVKRHFFQGLREIAKPANQAGPVAAATRHGLGGANLHLLADEQARLIALLRTPEQRASPSLLALTHALSDRVVAGLNAAQARLRRGAEEPDDDAMAEIVELVSLSTALRRWCGDEVGRLSPADIVHGCTLSTERGSPDAMAIAATCDRLVAGDAPLRSLAELTVADRTAEFEDDPRRLRLARALAGMVGEQVESTRMGLHGLLDFAQRAGVRLDAGAAAELQRGIGIIDAQSIRPAAATAQATGEAMAQFLGNVQFGNHSRLSSIDALGLSTRSLSANITTLKHPGDAHAAHHPAVVRADVSGDRAVERFVRAGAATHGGELILGEDTRGRLNLGAGAQYGRQWGAKHSVHGRVMLGGDATLYSRDDSRYEGAMLRVDRRVTADVPDDVAPQFTQGDQQVRETMAEMARELFGNGPRHVTPAERQQFFEQFIDRFMDRDLSLTLVKQDSTSHRSDITGSIGGSLATPQTKRSGFGVRFGTSGNVAAERAWRYSLSEKDSTGSYRINNVRNGWFTRRRAGVNVVGVNPVVEKAFGIPALSVANATATVPDGGGSVRVRVPTRNGNIVPEKTFSDTETPDRQFFKDLVLADKQKWIDLFAYKYRHEGAEQARQRGEADVDAFFYKADNVRDANHLYYARERMHPAVASRLDELAAIEHQIPRDDPAFAGFHAEVAGKRARLASDDRSWNPASLIAYQREVKQDGVGANTPIRAMRFSAVEGEREFIFDTIGWANLRQREREHPPRHLDE